MRSVSAQVRFNGAPPGRRHAWFGTLIINPPGKPSAIADYLDAVFRRVFTAST